MMTQLAFLDLAAKACPSTRGNVLRALDVGLQLGSRDHRSPAPGSTTRFRATGHRRLHAARPDLPPDDGMAGCSSRSSTSRKSSAVLARQARRPRSPRERLAAPHGPRRSAVGAEPELGAGTVDDHRVRDARHGECRCWTSPSPTSPLPAIQGRSPPASTRCPGCSPRIWRRTR